MPLLLLLLVGSIVHAVQYPHLVGFLLVFLIIAVVLVSLKTRMYALRVQDRLIRLEERLRLAAAASAQPATGNRRPFHSAAGRAALRV
jgi:hypothetical protein